MKKSWATLFSFSLLLLAGIQVQHCKAQTNVAGSIDITFNPGGSGFNPSDTDPGVYTIVFQSDGKMLVGGDFTTYNSTPVTGLVRLNADGTLDTDFTNAFTLAALTPPPAVQAIALQNIGGEEKIIIGGYFDSHTDTSTSTTTTVNNIARLNSDGTLDPNFLHGLATGVSGTLYALAVQPDDQKIVIGGSFDGYYESPTSYDANSIARLDSNGHFDTTFVNGSGNPFAGFTAVGTTTQPAVQTLALQQADGKILAGGSFNGYSPDGNMIDPVNSIARLNSDGTLDQDFVHGAGTGFDEANASTSPTTVYDLLIQPSGDIVVAGTFTDFTNASSPSNPITVNQFARLSSTGVLDEAFNSGPASGFAGSNPTATISLLPGLNNSVIVGGSFASYKGQSIGNLAQINSDGSLDTTFGVPGEDGFNDTILALALQGDTGIIVGGFFENFIVSSTERIDAGKIARVFYQIAPSPSPTPTATPTPTPTATPTPNPANLSTVSVVAKRKHFVLNRSGGDLSQELVVFYKIKTRSLDSGEPLITYKAKARFKSGETTKHIRLKKLKGVVAQTHEGLKVVLRILPSTDSSSQMSHTKTHKAYIRSADFRAILILLPPVIPIPTDCSVFPITIL